ncbi:MAG: VWA domain-containing protein [Spirochaetaceae bacterium]|jgi:Ca-activated chloride channel family protein|nr:VWA domain-containing protein [Spirochaetaceae bacterium]
MSIRFERPLFLILAGLAPFAILFCRRFLRPAVTVKLSLGPQGGTLFKPPRRAALGAVLMFAAELAAVSLLLLAIANPMEVTAVPVYKERGADIVFVLDVSPSMAVLDINSTGGGVSSGTGDSSGNRGGSGGAENGMINRFEAARFLILSFVNDHPSAAVGLVAVGEDAALLVPPTIDHELFRDRLQTLRIGELGDGTALGMGLSLAAFHLYDSSAPLRACVLVTDGENNAGAVHPETAAEVLASADAAFFVIGVGTGGETILDYVDPETNQHRRGLYDSRYDVQTLITIAEKGNGAFLQARTGDELGRAFFKVSEGSTLPVRVETLHVTESRAVPFIVAALLLITLSFLPRFLAPRLKPMVPGAADVSRY